jgi:hypothetical protein
MLTGNIRAAMRKADYEILPDDGSSYGEIEGFRGVYANADTLEADDVPFSPNPNTPASPGTAEGGPQTSPSSANAVVVSVGATTPNGPNRWPSSPHSSLPSARRRTPRGHREVHRRSSGEARASGGC